MSNKFTKTLVIGLVVVLVMSLGAAAVFAQDNTTQDTPSKPILPFGHSFHGRGFGDYNDEALADSLGITVEALQAARQQVEAARIAQAVEDGYLTQDQANTMLAMQALKEYVDREEILAQALGLTVDELTEAREAGTLRELLANITPADLQESMQTATEAAIQQAVTDKVITQDQADLVLEQIGSGLGMLGRFGGHHGFGGERDEFHGFGESQSGNLAPFGSDWNASAFDA